MTAQTKSHTCDPDIPLALVADVRRRLAANYVIYQPQIQGLMDAFDRLQERHREDLKKIRMLEKEREAHDQALVRQ